MGKIIITILAAAFMLPALAEDKGFESIFDGKTLKGWNGDPKFWSVKDGAITGQTTKGNLTMGNTFIIWEGGKTADFILELEFKINGGNSGIQYRSFKLPGKNDDWRIEGYQADFEAGDRYNGICYGERFRGILSDRGFKTTLTSPNNPTIIYWGKIDSICNLTIGRISQDSTVEKAQFAYSEFCRQVDQLSLQGVDKEATEAALILATLCNKQKTRLEVAKNSDEVADFIRAFSLGLSLNFFQISEELQKDVNLRKRAIEEFGEAEIKLRKIRFSLSKKLKIDLAPIGSGFGNNYGKLQKKAEKFGDSKEIGKAVKKKEWNKYRIVAEDFHFVHFINDVKTMVLVDNDEKARRADGLLALQLHQGPPMTVQFRNIRIKHLK